MQYHAAAFPLVPSTRHQCESFSFSFFTFSPLFSFLIFLSFLASQHSMDIRKRDYVCMQESLQIVIFMSQEKKGRKRVTERIQLSLDKCSIRL